MHKSRVFTFGFLISLLIMLAAIPVLNQPNSFSNTLAMAQEYDNYDDNKYSQYPKVHQVPLAQLVHLVQPAHKAHLAQQVVNKVRKVCQGQQEPLVHKDHKVKED